ncbi:MAG: uracil phosphoribosyltransferase [Thermomicrobiales bacterium]
MFMHAGKPMRDTGQPTRDAVGGLLQLHVSRHPVVAHKLTILRDMTTESAAFRHAMTDLTVCLAYEALAAMRSTQIRVQTPLEETDGTTLNERFAIVPVLRAGLGMVDGFLSLFPSLQVWHIGLYRDEASLQPVTYYNRLPALATVDTCFVLDPMLATGGSAVQSIAILKEWGARDIAYVGIIAAPYGVQRLVDAHPDVGIHVAALDRALNEDGYIVPGLGDAGDRLYRTGGTLPQTADHGG